MRSESGTYQRAMATLLAIVATRQVLGPPNTDFGWFAGLVSVVAIYAVALWKSRD